MLQTTLAPVLGPSYLNVFKCWRMIKVYFIIKNEYTPLIYYDVLHSYGWTRNCGYKIQFLLTKTAENYANILFFLDSCSKR